MTAYVCQNAIDYAANFCKKQVREPDVDVTIADTVNSMMWIAFEWRWTQGSITSIPLVNGTQDYAIPNTDFYRLLRARITRTDITPHAFNDVGITQWLPPELQMTGASPTDFRTVCFEPALQKIRLDKAAQIASPVTMQIDGEYQKMPTKVTSLSQSPFMPDVYFQTYSEGVLWKMFVYMEDSRAGGLVIDGQGQRKYTGQLSVFMDAFTAMLRAEDYQDSSAQRFPDSAFGQGRASYPGLFAWS